MVENQYIATTRLGLEFRRGYVLAKMLAFLFKVMLTTVNVRLYTERDFNRNQVSAYYFLCVTLILLTTEWLSRKGGVAVKLLCELNVQSLQITVNKTVPLES